MRVFFTNLGCKLNQAEVERLAASFSAAGHRVAASLEEADLHVVNTCTVTHVAARASRKAARRGARRSPGLRTVVTGCWASERPAAAEALEGVDLVVPNARKDGLLEDVHRAFPELRPDSGPAAGPAAGAGDPTASRPAPFELAGGHTRSLVKIEDGCDMRCSFCIIPFTRGAQRSRPVAEVVAEVGRLVERGAREVVLTGVQISAYRAGGARLADLVAAVLGETAVPRLRLTSIAPWRLDRRLLALWADPRLCRHVHLSLQSGCDATLSRMRRPYTAARFAGAVAAIRDAAPGVAVTTDVIVGFPGEDETEFQESLAFTAETGFARVHAFPYSRRTGTAAAAHGDGVPVAVVRRRMAAMLAVAEASERRYRERHVGATVEVLWERRRAVRWRGLTGNYLRVYAPVEGEQLGNRITEARLLALSGDGLLGRPGAAAAG